MAAIDIVVPAGDVRRWHVVLAERLRAAGHDALLAAVDAPAVSRSLDGLLRLERALLGGNGDALYVRAAGAAPGKPRDRPALVIDLTGADHIARAPSMKPRFAGGYGPADAALSLMRGELPDIVVELDGYPVARGAPMVDSRISLTRGLDDVLARTVTLLCDQARRQLDESRPAGLPFAPSVPQGRGRRSGVMATYLARSAPRRARAVLRRLVSGPRHWRVGYRFGDGAGVAETGLLAGAPWTVLPDDGERFYADPFPFEREGRYFIFVEEFAHASGKGVISVAEIGDDGTASVPQRVLEEPYHLSYPQVFARDGEIWMLPEGGGGRNLVLYRADPFPHVWKRYKVLVPDRALFDATLLDHGGRLWLFATEQDGYGSSADTLVVYSAPELDGPWTPHPQNPVMIDRAAARPGGAFRRAGDRIVLPVQDGTEHYGGGLGLTDLVELDEDRIRLTRPVPILPCVDWPYPRIHTLNRAGRLETIDGIVPARKRAAGP